MTKPEKWSITKVARGMMILGALGVISLAPLPAGAVCRGAEGCTICTILYATENGECTYTSVRCADGSSGTTVDCLIY